MSKPEIWDWLTLPFTYAEKGWREKALPAAGPIYIVRAFAARERIVDTHSHEFECLLYTIRGTGRAICGSQEFALAPGTTLRVPAGVPHGATFDAGWEGLEIGLADEARLASAA